MSESSPRRRLTFTDWILVGFIVVVIGFGYFSELPEVLRDIDLLHKRRHRGREVDVVCTAVVDECLESGHYWLL